MSAVAKPAASLRADPMDSSWLAWAFGISLALHLLSYGGYQLGKKFHWWDSARWPHWLQSAKTLAEMLKKKEEAQPPQPRDVPLMFVEVNPAQASTEAPKKSAYYSDKNSQAANPDAKIESAIPNIDGKQTEMVKTENVPRSKAFPLNPTVPAEPAKEAQEELKPKAAYTPGALTMAKPAPTPGPDEGEAAHARPRRLADVKPRPNSQLTGEKMKQEGGVKRRGQSTLDVSLTGFGTYDAVFLAAVQNRWFTLLDNRNYSGEGNGKVTVRFLLHSKGAISEISLTEYTVDYTLALLCKSAIEDNAPYAEWPSDMKREIGADFRECTFTFFYH